MDTCHRSREAGSCMGGMVIQESASFDEESQCTVGSTPLMSFTAEKDSVAFGDDMNVQDFDTKSSSLTSNSSVKDTCTLHIQKFKVLLYPSSGSSSPFPSRQSLVVPICRPPCYSNTRMQSFKPMKLLSL